MISITDFNFFCWVTLADSEKYLNEAFALALSLKKVNTMYPLYIIIPNTFSNHPKYQEFLQIKDKYLSNVFVLEKPALSFRDDHIGFASTINKFYCIELLEKYNKVCFVDSDVIFYKNYDHIFFFEENNNNLKASWRPARDGNGNEESICGDVMVFCQDHKHLLDYVKQHALEYNQDETVVNELFYNTKRCSFFKDDIRFDNSQFTIHDAGYPKTFSYFTNFESIVELFDSRTVDEIRQLIDLFIDTYKRCYCERVLEANFNT